MGGRCSYSSVYDQTAYSGSNSAYCGAIKQICDTWGPETGCVTIYNYEHIYTPLMETTMSMDLGLELDDTNWFTAKIFTDLAISEFEEESADYMFFFVGFSYINEDGFSVISSHPLGTVPYQSNWVNIVYQLPDLSELDPTSVSLGIGFESDYDQNSNAGAYIDDVKIVTVDGDLSISACNTNLPPYPDDLSFPRVVTMELDYWGSGESGDFTVSYSVGENPDPTSLIGHTLVPSIPDGGWEQVELEIPYLNDKSGNNSEDEKLFDEDLSQRIHIFIDSNNDVIETDENNNLISNYDLTWSVPNAPVILIHGLGGGALKKNNYRLYGEDAQITFLTTLLNQSKLMRSFSTDNEHDTGIMFTPSAYSGNGFIRDFGFEIHQTVLWGLGRLSQLVPVPELSGMWYAIISNLTDSGNNTEGNYILPSVDPPQNSQHDQDIFLFNYDWRLDIDPDRIQNLNGSTSNCYARLDSLVNWIKQNHVGAERLTIVSHSMGGLITQAYLRKNPEDHGVYRWITLGTPFQGSETALASLFGKSGLSLLGGSVRVPIDMADMVQEFVSVWECLPTPWFDLKAPLYDEWEGHQPFNVVDPSWVCGSGCSRYPIPVYPNTSMGEIRYAGDNGGFPGWSFSERAHELSESYQLHYMDMDIAEQISGVDTWLIAGDEISTLRGINRYSKEYAILDPMVMPEWLIETTHDVAFGPGDGQVGTWSATEANVAEENLHLCFAPGVDHIDLIRSGDIGNFVGDIIRGRSLTSYYPSVVDSVSQVSPNSESPWVIKWETDTAIWADKDGEKSSYSGMPVSLDLIDLSTNTILIGLSHVDVPEGYDYEGPLSVTTVYDSRFSYMEIGGDVFIYSDCMDHMDLRVIIRPHPQVFDTEQAYPPSYLKEQKGEIGLVLGHLKIMESFGGRVWSFPDETCDVDFIKFTSTGDVGYGAYIDFPIQNGDIAQSLVTMLVDGDGDGEADAGGDITGVSDELITSPEIFDKVVGSPNPFNASTSLAWEIKDGTGTALDIHDVSGKLVRVLKLNGESRGVEFFDGRDSRGVSLASGVYLVTVKDENNMPRTMSKITIVK